MTPETPAEHVATALQMLDRDAWHLLDPVERVQILQGVRLRLTLALDQLRCTEPEHLTDASETTTVAGRRRGP